MRLTAKATSAVRRDLERASDKTGCKYRMASGTAMTMYKDNDTSVTRGSATMKAERLDSYETVSRLSPDDFPQLRGVADKYEPYILWHTPEGRSSMLRDDWIFRRGDIYLADLNPFFGSEQGGTRPVLVLQNNTGNFYCPTLIVAPMTSQSNKKRNQPTHYHLDHVHGLNEPSVALLEQITTIDKRRVIKYIGKLSREQLDTLNDFIEISLGLYIPEDVEAP